MNSRERTLASMAQEEPDKVPIYEICINYPKVKEILGSEGKFDKTWKILHFETSELAKAYDKVGLDIFSVFPGHPENFKPKWIENRTYADEWGRCWRLCGENMGYGPGSDFYAGAALQTLDDLMSLPLDAELHGWMTPVEEMVKEAKPYKKAVMGVDVGVFDNVYLAFGFDRLISSFYQELTFARKAMSKIIEVQIGLYRQMVECGIDAFLYGDDIAYKHGPIVSPMMYRNMIMPFHSRVAYEVKKMGIPIFFHSDGNLYTVIDDLISAGFMGLHAIEPSAGMDIGVVKEKWGDKLVVIGNVECGWTLSKATVEEVVKETKEVISKASPGGGHIISSSNVIHDGVKLENYYAMLKTIEKYGKYPLAIPKKASI